MEPTHQRSTMMRKFEIDEGALISYEISVQTCVTAAADIAKYLDPPCILHFMNVHASLQKTLSRFYCTKHGSEFLKEGEGLCQEHVEEQIQRDGHNIQSFREKLAARTAFVHPRDWHRDIPLSQYGPKMPLDCDPIYSKYLCMLKECKECDVEATDRAMAGIGLPHCVYCKRYVDIRCTKACGVCQRAWVCNSYCVRGSRECNSFQCQKCLPLLFCERCSDAQCDRHLTMPLCQLCGYRVCESCISELYGNLSACEECGDAYCHDHMLIFACKKKCKVMFCRDCKDSFQCKHYGSFFKVEI